MIDAKEDVKMEFKSFSLMLNDTRVETFADFLAKGKILGTKCKKCGSEYYPPRSECCQCLGEDMEWFECPTQGTLLTFTQVMVLPEHAALPEASIPFSKATLIPSPVGLVEVKGGIRIMGWIPKAMPEDLRVGDRMKVSSQLLDNGHVTITLEKLE